MKCPSLFKLLLICNFHYEIVSNVIIIPATIKILSKLRHTYMWSLRQILVQIIRFSQMILNFSEQIHFEMIKEFVCSDPSLFFLYPLTSIISSESNSIYSIQQCFFFFFFRSLDKKYHLIIICHCWNSSPKISHLPIWRTVSAVLTIIHYTKWHRERARFSCFSAL